MIFHESISDPCSCGYTSTAYQVGVWGHTSLEFFFIGKGMKSLCWNAFRGSFLETTPIFLVFILNNVGSGYLKKETENLAGLMEAGENWSSLSTRKVLIEIKTQFKSSKLCLLLYLMCRNTNGIEKTSIITYIWQKMVFWGLLRAIFRYFSWKNVIHINIRYQNVISHDWKTLLIFNNTSIMTWDA